MTAPHDLEEMAALLGLGMADNPLHLAAYRGDESHRARSHARMMRTLLASSPAMAVDRVFRDGFLVGLAASASPGACRPGTVARLRLLGTAASLGPGIARRLLAWSEGWARHDLPEPHVHLGPVAVARHLRGRGIGTALLRRHVAQLDAGGALGYLESDRPGAVDLYRRFGYVVVGEIAILGVPTWRMRRAPG